MNLKKLIFFLSVLLILSYGSKAQDNLGKLLVIDKQLNGGLEKYLNSYLSPHLDMLGTGLNGGWYNTAKVHGVLGFDISFTTSLVAAPSSKKKFNLGDTPFGNNVTSGSKEVPTIIGDESSGTKVGTMVEGQEVAFDLPGGIDFGYVPVPMVKAAVGLPKGFEIMARFIPTLEVSDLEVGLWGVGLKYNIGKLLFAVDKIPFVNLAVMGAYTKFDMSVGIESLPEAGNYDKSIFANQEIGLKSTAFTLRALGSVDIPFITAYMGVGYGSTSTEAGMYGTYATKIGTELNNMGKIISDPISNVTDPIKFDSSTGNFDFNAGIKLKLAFFHFFADYTLNEYAVYTGGIAFSFR